MRKPASNEKKRAYWRKWYDANRERISPARRMRQKTYWERHPEELLWHNAKARARRLNLPFSITVEDIVIPETCPVLGIRLQRGAKKFGAASPSLDRLTPELGYIPGNIGVISWRANGIKSNATLQELQAVAAWVSKL